MILEKGSLEKSKGIDVTDIRSLLKESLSYLSSKAIGPYGVIGPYGIAYQLKRYAEIDTNILLNKCSFEHGPYFYKMVCHIEVSHHVSHILTYSPYRENVIRELTDLNPIAIGPYIAYAEDYRSQKSIEEIKKTLGKTLLVMPIHSTNKEIFKYNVDEFIMQIENFKRDFDTVMVCIHFEDMIKGLWKPYKKKGYYIVSAGNILSPFFLSRTKYIFKLADAFIANSVTTGMAFAMYMNCPIQLICQEYNVTSSSNLNQLEVDDISSRAYELFSDNNFITSEEQKKFGDFVFGLKNIKAKEEIKLLLKSIARV